MCCIIKKCCVGEDCVCQVFRQDIGWNKLNIEFAFFPKKCFEVSYLIDSVVWIVSCFCLKQNVRHLYQSVYVEEGSPYDLDFLSDTINVIPPLHLHDWNVTIDTQEVGMQGCCSIMLLTNTVSLCICTQRHIIILLRIFVCT